MKRKLLWVLGAYLLYLAGGIALAAMGQLKRVYFFPGWAIKSPQHDESGFAADGPLVVYQGAQATVAAIVPGRTGPVVQRTAPAALTDTLLRCYVSDPATSFTFPLHSLGNLPSSTYPAAVKMLVLSDIEGNFKGLSLLLQKMGVVDATYHWQFGTNQLVVVGDLFDRGTQVTECLWLLYKLEREAAQAGGQVHVLLGNHETMNLTGNYKYVRRKYRRNADSLGLPYTRWYGPDTELGRWLRHKNTVEKIGSTLFVHGGISPELAAYHLSLEEINARMRTLLDTPHREQLTGLDSLLAHSQSSPDWYRGLAREQAPASFVTQLLAGYGATRLVIGHTPFEEITPLYDGRVVAIDLPHQENTEAGVMKALWIENGKYYAVRTDSGQRQPL
jgi:hypothetical protein